MQTFVGFGAELTSAPRPSVRLAGECACALLKHLIYNGIEQVDPRCLAVMQRMCHDQIRLDMHSDAPQVSATDGCTQHTERQLSAIFILFSRTKAHQKKLRSCCRCSDRARRLIVHVLAPLSRLKRRHFPLETSPSAQFFMSVDNFLVTELWKLQLR
jgi:hypothetical protein